MSAPETNVETQKRRHSPALIGIIVSVSLAAVALVIVLLWGGIPTSEQAAPNVVNDPVAVQE